MLAISSFTGRYLVATVTCTPRYGTGGLPRKKFVEAQHSLARAHTNYEAADSRRRSRTGPSYGYRTCRSTEAYSYCKAGVCLCKDFALLSTAVHILTSTLRSNPVWRSRRAVWYSC